MKGLIGKKVGMTQVYDEKGILIPVTVIEAGPCVVVGVKTKERDGYSALQVGFGSKKAKNTSKTVIGNVKQAGLAENPPAVIREFRADADPSEEIGAQIKADIFAEGEFLDISGFTKGKGYQGVMKRHHFGGQQFSHGTSVEHRHGGSSGAISYPGRVFPGKRMPGHMGSEKVTVKNLTVMAVDLENNLLLVKGAVPGAKNSLVALYKKG